MSDENKEIKQNKTVNEELSSFFSWLFGHFFLSLFVFICVFIYLLAASIGVNYTKNRNITIKIFAFLFFGFLNILTLLWYFIFKCWIMKEPLELATPFPF